MLRSAISKMMWLGRATSAVVGLAILLALAIGAANSALAHTNVDNKLFHLNHNNFVSTALTKLTGTLAGPVLRLDNNSTDTRATALALQVEPGKAPMSVNASAGTATGLSADELDGKDSAGFLPSETYLAEQSRTQAANSRSATVVSCDDGDLAISGGFRSVDPASHVWSSAHEIGDNAWVVDVLTGSTSDSYTAQAVCADFAPLHHEIEPL